MCCTNKKKQLWQPPINRMTHFPVKFDQDQVVQLHKKFKKMAGSEKVINKAHFQNNMGIMGLQSIHGFSDRLFNSFDLDQDGKICFQDFVQYMQIMKCGTQENKALISYRLIDIKNKGSVSINDFKSFLSDYFISWSSITNAVVTQKFKQQTQNYINQLFTKVQQDTGKKYITFDYYSKNMYGKKDFMDAFSFISQGVAEMEMFIEDGKGSAQSYAHYQTLVKIRDLYKKHFQKWRFQQKQQQINPQGLNFSSKSPHFMQPNQQQNKKKEQIPFHTKLFGSCQRDNGQNLEFSQQYMNSKSLQRKLQNIQKDLYQIIEVSKEQFQKFQSKRKTVEHQQFDIGSIILNIPKQPTKKSKAQGKMIVFGDQKWNLVLNMMIGIQMAVNSVRGYQDMFFQIPQDFHLKYNFELIPRRFGQEKKTKKICHFTDYAPNTFNHIRKIFGIDNSDYINSIGPSKLMKSLMMGQINSLTELTSQGKSGSFFYYSTDGKYMLKTIQHREYKLLRSILRDYYHYLKDNPNSLLIKFFGLHRLQFQSDLAKEDESGKIYFVIMGNVFNVKDKIYERYDIKGSTVGRTNKSQNPNATKKDLDFLEKYPKGIKIKQQNRQKIMDTLRKDAIFLKQHQIIDYSVLVGMFRKQKKLIQQMLSFSFKKAQNQDQFQLNNLYMIEDTKQGIILGVIDILIQYDGVKTLEYYFKRVTQGQGASAVPPNHYADRFIHFLQNKVFPSSSTQLKNRNTYQMIQN